MNPFVTAFAAVSLVAAASGASAQAFPNRPIKVIVGYLAGGGVDITARQIAEPLREILGQPIVIENRAGASGMLAAGTVAKSPADGYTLLLSAAGEIVTNQHLYKQKMPYDPERDLAPITNVVIMPNVLVVNPDVPANTVSELIAYAKARPKQLTFSSSGIGNPLHLAGELFNHMAGIEVTHVPYKGAAQQVADVAAKHITMTFASVAVTQPLIKGGQVKALGVSSAKRIVALPNVPAITESLPGYELVNWYGLFAAGGTPQAVIDTLNAAVVKVLRSPDIVAKLQAQGGEPAPSNPTEFRKFLQAETAKFGRVVQQANVVLTD